MASGEVLVSTLTDSLNTMLASARIVREYTGVMPNLADKETLKDNTGLAWRESSYAKLTASNVAEADRFNNPQEFSDSLTSVTPSMTGVHTIVTDRVMRRLSTEAFPKMGQLAMNAMQRKKDADGLVVLDGATTSLSGTGTTLQSGVLFAAISRIQGNTTEPGEPPIYVCLHPYQLKDIEDELRAGVGTYAIPPGLTTDTFKNGYQGRIGGGEIYIDGNITITSNDAKGGVWAKKAILLVQGKAPWKKTREEPDFGGGATSIWLYDEYGWGERSAGNWLFEVLSDASVPTS